MWGHKNETMKNYKEKLKHIRAFVLDFDGVISNGMVYVTADGEQVRATNVKDGYALHYALKKGYKVAVISGGYAESMKLRFREFHGMEFFLHVSDKIKVFNEYLANNDLKPEEVLVMGDDIPDYQMMKLAGVKCCPANAATEIQELADYISIRNGGDGAVRDVIEQTMRLQGTWFDTDAHIW